MSPGPKLILRLRISLIFVCLLLVATTTVVSAQTGTALGTQWTSSITFQNVGWADAPVMMEFYKEGLATAQRYVVAPASLSNPLKAGAASSFRVGSIRSGSFLVGNVIVSGGQPTIATLVQYSIESGFRMRLLYNGFRADKASTQFMIPTVLRNRFNRTTVVYIQNVESEAVTVTVRFYNADDGSLTATRTFNIAPDSSKWVQMHDRLDVGDQIIDNFPNGYNGSAIITSQTASGQAGRVVAAAGEYYVNSKVATAFEGVPLADAATTLYMPTALCADQNSRLDTFYAIQNASMTAATTVTIHPLLRLAWRPTGAVYPPHTWARSKV